MSQGCSEYQQVHISQALWFPQTKGSAELQSMIIQPNGLCGVFEMTREEADRLLVPTVALPIAKLPQSPSPRQGQSSGSHAVSALGYTLPYIVNGEGIPLCAYFQFTFPNSIGKHRFQLWLTGLPLPGLVPQVRAPYTSLLKDESEWVCSFGNPDSFSKEGTSRCTYAQIMPTSNQANPT